MDIQLLGSLNYLFSKRKFKKKQKEDKKDTSIKPVDTSMNSKSSTEKEKGKIIDILI